MSFSAGGFSEIGIGANTGNLAFDQLSIAPDGGSITLIPGVPQIVAINPLTFGVDVNSCCEELVAGLSAPRFLTLNGVTEIVTQPFQVAISYSDTLTIFAGPMVEFDLGHGSHVQVTLLGVSPLTQGVGSAHGAIQAEFLDMPEPGPLASTPEPGTLAMLGLGLIGLAGLARRCARN